VTPNSKRICLSSLLCVAVLFGSGACRSGLRDGAYYKGNNRYALGAPPSGFRRLDLKGNDLAFLSDASGHSLAINSTCENYEDANLEVLTNHVLMGFGDKTRISQEVVRFDGRDSLQSHVRATLDGVPVELFLIVVKKNGCIYDFTYLSPVGQFAAHYATFRALVDPFHAEAMK
jgi:hypothetical protein